VSLLDELRKAAGQLDPSLQPSSNEVGPILGALIAYTEHGDKFLKAADKGAGDVSELLAGGEEPPKPAATGAPKGKD
jgi:hypothetical protein